MAAAPAFQEIRAESYVGFDSITQQIEHKLLKRGFQFNVILVGACRTNFAFALRQRIVQKMIFFLFLHAYRFVLQDKLGSGREVDAHQHHFRVPPHRHQGPVRVGRTRQADDRDSSDLTR